MFRIVRRENFSPIFSLFDEFVKNTAFEDVKSISENECFGAIALDWVESEKEYRIMANLPGFCKEDVKITLDKNLLTVEAFQKKENEEEKPLYRRRERFCGNYRRVIYLPDNIIKDNIKAKMENGLLELTIQKATETQHSLIAIE